jgi:hypothetical protein
LVDIRRYFSAFNLAQSLSLQGSLQNRFTASLASSLTTDKSFQKRRSWVGISRPAVEGRKLLCWRTTKAKGQPHEAEVGIKR